MPQLRWVVALVIGFAGSAAAAPKYTRTPSHSTDPAMVHAELAWAAAVAETRPREAGSAWEKVAGEFLTIAEGSKVTHAEQIETAYAAVLAIKNALNAAPRSRDGSEPEVLDANGLPKPRPLPPRSQLLLQVIDVYERVDATSDEAIALRFIAANTLRRFDHLAEAIPILLEIVDHHAGHETAEFAANLVLDAYIRLEDYDSVVALVDRLIADGRLLKLYEELANKVLRLHAQIGRKAAEQLEHRAHDVAGFDRCGDQYAALATESHTADADELLYNAAVCYERAGSVDRVRVMATRLFEKFPRSKLRARMLGRLIAIEERIGRYDAAAAAAESYVARFPKERDAGDAITDAIVFRIALGELDVAGRDLDALQRRGSSGVSTAIDVGNWLELPAELTAREQAALGRVGATPTDRVAVLTIALGDALLVAGRRSDAARRVRNLPASASFGLADPVTLHAARVIADASCPVALDAELCPRPRDRENAMLARQLLRNVASGSELTPSKELAARVMLDLDLEAALARPATSELARIADRLRELASASHRPELRLAAHERLARLARRAGDSREALAQLDACIAEARHDGTPAWLATCERERAAQTRAPIDDALVEHLPSPVMPAVIADEPALDERAGE